MTDGHHAVEVVEQALAAGKVVLGDGAGEGALGGVGDDQERPSVLALEFQKVHHELAGIDTLVGVRAEVADVIHDAGLAPFAEHRLFDAFEDAGLIVLGRDGGGVDFGTVEVPGEFVESTGVLVGVAELKLFLGQLAVQVKHRPVGGNAFRNLDGVDGFAEVGIGEEAAHFSLVPEGVEEFVRVGASGGILQGLVGLLDGEHSHLVRILCGFDGAGYGLDGVGFHSYFLRQGLMRMLAPQRV